MPTGDPYAWISKSLAAIQHAHRYRSVQAIEGMSGPVVQSQGQTLVNFASNDYLGLTSHPKVIQAAVTATQVYGTGSTGSQLLSGHRCLHRELEDAISSLKQTADAVVFSSGYLANIGTIAALVGSPDLILADEYNHSSLKNGARISGAATLDYRHGDVNHLKTLLANHRPNYRRCLIITDSVFSMDGDLCPLPEILTLGDTHDAMVMVDEAHSTGVLGKKGAGCVEHFGCTGRPLIQMGTLSKALGSLGGYVAGSTALIDFLRNRAPAWIYTTALSPGDTAAALAAITLVQQEPEHQQNLWRNMNYLTQKMDAVFTQAQLAPAAIKRLPSQSPIICLEFSSAQAVLAAGAKLQQQGLWVSAVRPPTVPTSRLRITLMASHQQQHLDQLITALSEMVQAV